MVSNQVDNQVVTLGTSREILSSVINDSIRTQRADHFHVSGTADTRHLCAECLCDLHCEGPDTSRGTVDQDLLARLNFSFISEPLQCSDASDGYGRGLLERQVGRF